MVHLRYLSAGMYSVCQPKLLAILQLAGCAVKARKGRFQIHTINRAGTPFSARGGEERTRVDVSKSGNALKVRGFVSLVEEKKSLATCMSSTQIDDQGYK